MNRADAACALTRWQHYHAYNDVMATILKVWRQIENPTPSIDAYLLEEQSCQTSFRFDLKRWSLKLFWTDRPNNRTTATGTTTITTRWVSTWGHFLVQKIRSNMPLINHRHAYHSSYLYVNRWWLCLRRRSISSRSWKPVTSANSRGE